MTRNAGGNTSRNGFADDLRQSVVVMKNELRKFFRGKKMLIFAILMALVLSMLTIMPYVFGTGLGSDVGQTTVMYLSFVSIIVLLAATLFSSTSIVSEFEERTALILFTRPIRKSSIFLGKFLASFVMCVAFLAIYYLITAMVLQVLVGGVDAGMCASFGMAVLYTFGMIGVALLISSLMKKGSTASILTFVTIMLIMPVMSSVLSISGIDTWWIISQCDSSILGVLDGYSATMAVDIPKSVGTMAAWGVITGAISYWLFKRRDF